MGGFNIKVYPEEKIFADLSWYKSNFKFAEESAKRQRKIYRLEFSYKKYKNFKHKDSFLYNCKKCGISFHKNYNYCTNCGARLDKSYVYSDILKIFEEYQMEPTIKRIPETYVTSMKEDYYFNKCEGILEALFYVATSHKFDKEYAMKCLNRINSFKELTQQLLLRDFANKMIFYHNEILGYISNWKGFKLIFEDDISEVDILSNLCEVRTPYNPPSHIVNEQIYEMGKKHTKKELSLGGYYLASKLIIGELLGNGDNIIFKTEFIDDVLCMKLLAIASSWYYCRLNTYKRYFTPNKKTYWEFVWSCQLNPSDELKLYYLVDALATE